MLTRRPHALTYSTPTHCWAQNCLGFFSRFLPNSELEQSAITKYRTCCNTDKTDTDQPQSAIVSPWADNANGRVTVSFLVSQHWGKNYIENDLSPLHFIIKVVRRESLNWCEGWGGDCGDGRPIHGNWSKKLLVKIPDKKLATTLLIIIWWCDVSPPQTTNPPALDISWLMLVFINHMEYIQGFRLCSYVSCHLMKQCFQVECRKIKQ